MRLLRILSALLGRSFDDMLLVHPQIGFAPRVFFARFDWDGEEFFMLFACVPTLCSLFPVVTCIFTCLMACDATIIDVPSADTTSIDGSNDDNSANTDAGSQISTGNDAGSNNPSPNADAGFPISPVDAGSNNSPDAGAPVDAGADAGVVQGGWLPSDWPSDWGSGEDRMLELVNQMRQQGGNCPSGAMPPVAPLRMNKELRLAARLHSKDMADQNYFSHDSLDGRSPWQRMGEAGYQGSPVGENIAAGSNSAEGTFSQWVNSDGHCRNMMSAQASEIGIGHAVGAGQYGNYWTQTFGFGAGN